MHPIVMTDFASVASCGSLLRVHHQLPSLRSVREDGGSSHRAKTAKRKSQKRAKEGQFGRAQEREIEAKRSEACAEAASARTGFLYGPPSRQKGAWAWVTLMLPLQILLRMARLPARSARNGTTPRERNTRIRCEPLRSRCRWRERPRIR